MNKKNIMGIIRNTKKYIHRLINLIKGKLNRLFAETSLYFITSNDYLPEPLTKEEEEKLVKEFEETKDDDVRNILVERNLRLVVYIAKKFENSGVGIEDLISIGTVGLIKGINTFKLDKNIKLATYASKCIENEILMYIRKVSKIRQEVSFDVPISGDQDGNELLLSDTIKTEERDVYSDIEKEVDKVVLDKLIDNLSPREKEIISLRYGLSNEYTDFIFDMKRKELGNHNKEKINEEKMLNYDDELTQKEVADYLGISQSYISRIEKKIMRRLKRELVKYY